MAFRFTSGRFLTGFALAGFVLAAAGCQSGDGGGVLGLGGDKEKKPQEGKVLASELLGYCPQVTLKEDTGYFNRYAKLSDEEATETALGIWNTINLVNLRENVLPTRPRATLILKKGADHVIEKVSLRRL